MILSKTSRIFLLLSALVLSFSQCSSTKKKIKISDTISVSKALQSEVYYQSWIAGVRGGGSGIDLYISKAAVEDKELITAYFNEKMIDFDSVTKESNMYVARFKNEVNQINDINMDADAINEYGNKVPVKKINFPFSLEFNEAVVSYIENKKTYYLKVINISKKETLAYPSVPKY